MSKRLCATLLTALLAATLPGCCGDPGGGPGPPPAAGVEPGVEPGQPAPKGPAPGESTFTHEITVDTAYYTGGPQQARPPDGTLKAGTKVELIEEAGSYCRVRSEDGTEAYVGVDSLKKIE